MEGPKKLNVSRCSSSSPSSTQPPSHHVCIPTLPTKHLRHPVRTQRQTSSHQFFALLIFLTCCISLSSASPTLYIDEQLVEARSVVSEPLGSTFARLARSGTILVDQSPPPEANYWTEDHAAEDLRRRAESNTNSSSTKTNTSSSTLAPTSTSSGIAAAEATSNSPLPTPFDVGFSSNITSNCASFMQSMLSNETFKSCLPFSLLLQNSNSFFQASKSLVRITQTLDYSCSANVTACSALLSSYATNITSSSACATDLSSQNPLIQQARLGLQAYKTLYTASCLRNPTTSAYCFAEAITNASNPTDSYIYFLPLNISLVGGSQPTCDSCLQNTMSVFEAASGDRSSSLASTYVPAAMQVNVNCGPGFVNASLAAAVNSAAPYSAPASSSGTLGLLTLFVVLVSWLL